MNPDTCTFCGGTSLKRLGPGRLLKDDVPRISRHEVGDNDAIFQCQNPLCKGIFGASRIRSYPLIEGKMGLGNGTIV